MADVRTIYVDLDHGLLRIDLLRERLALAILRRPLLFFESILWLVRGGRPRFKTEIARRATLDIPYLPFNTKLVSFLHEERESGMHLVLATAAPHAWAQSISDHLNLFDRVLATDESIGNLKGQRKLEVILGDAAGKPFGYAGGPADQAILRASDLPIIVGGSKSLVGNKAERAVVIKGGPSIAEGLVKSLRPYQWCRNVLLFIPAIAAHQPGKICPNGYFAFLSFSFVASAFYILNDFCDLDLDRRHPEKKFRAQASGAIRSSHAMILSAILLIISVTAAIPLPGQFDLILLGYGISCTFYSLIVRHVAGLNLLTLAFLSQLRIIAGGVACAIPISGWLLAFVFFFALSIAHLKRYLALAQELKSAGQPVSSKDLSLLSKFGHTSGLVSLFVLALYTSSETALTQYRHPALLFLVCVLIFFWLERIWSRASRDQIYSDPIVFIITDVMSYAVAILTLVIIWFASA